MSEGGSRLGFRADLEGLRALAISLVIAAHADVSWLAGGYVGVDVFFVLSGFLITGLLAQEIMATGRVAFADFYLRRLRRLMPALVCMLLLSSLAAGLLMAPSVQPVHARAGAMAALWLSNIHFFSAHHDYFAAGSDTNLFLHTWSLGVEEQFYLVWPALLLGVLGPKPGRAGVGRLARVLLGVGVLSLSACLVLTYMQPQFAFYMMPTRAWQFAIGGVVWIYGNGGGRGSDVPTRSTSPIVRHCVGWIGFAAVMGASILFSGAMSYPGWRAAVPTLGAAAMIWAGSGVNPGGVSRWLAARPCQAVGKLSYSWYLWHWPTLLLAYVLTESHDPSVRISAVLFSLGLATLSYRCVEVPCRERIHWGGRRGIAMAGALCVTLLVCLLMAQWQAYARNAEEAHRYASFRQDAPLFYDKDCDQWYHSDRVVTCSFGPAAAPHTAVLMGDSIAGHWFPALSRIFGEPHWRLLVITKSACPMVDEPFFYERLGREYTECASWRKKAIEQLVAMKPEVVVLSTSGTDQFTQAQWTDGSARVLGRLSQAASRVYVIRSTPHLPFDGPDCLEAFWGRPSWMRRSEGCVAPLQDDQGQRVYQWLQQAGEPFANVHLIDMNDQICPQSRCKAELGGHVVFRDDQHITASFAATLAPEMARRMALPGEASVPPGAEAALP